MKALLKKKIIIVLLYFMIKDITVDTIINTTSAFGSKLVYPLVEN